MPFTDNRRFKAKPKLVASAKDMYFTTAEGKQVLDGLATLWCVNAGHGRPRIVEAIRKQAGELDFAASFSLGHPLPSASPSASRRSRRRAWATCSSPTRARRRSTPRSRSRSPITACAARARARASSAASAPTTASTSPASRSAAWRSNRKAYSGALLPGVDHLRHTHGLSENLFSRGQPPTRRRARRRARRAHHRAARRLEHRRA